MISVCFAIGTQKDIKRRKKNMLRPGTKPKRDIMALLAAVSDKKKSEVCCGCGV